MPYFNINFI